MGLANPISSRDLTSLALALGLNPSGLSTDQTSQQVAGKYDLARCNLVPFLDALGASTYTEFGFQDQPTPIGTFYNSAGVGNVGSPVGQPRPFNRVEADIVSYNTSVPITEGRCLVRSVNATGTILGVATAALNILPSVVGPNPPFTTVLTPYRAAFDFGAQIVPSGNLWVEMHFNGLVFFREGTYTYTTGLGYPECAVNTNAQNYIYFDPTAFQQTTNLATINIWYRFSTSDCTYAFESGYAGTVANATSTFCGWGGPIGAPTQFNRVEFDICAFNAQSIPQNGRVRLFVNNQSGTMLADKQIQINIPYYLIQSGLSATGIGTNARTYRVVVDLDSTIYNSSAQTIWLDFQFDGVCGVRQLTSVVYPVSSGYTIAAFTTSLYAVGSTLPVTGTPNLTTTWNNVSSNFNIYARCSYIAQNARRVRSLGEMVNLLNNFKAQQVRPEILLPATLYATVGHEFVIYFDNVIAPPEGMHTNYASPAYEYQVVTPTNLGTQYSERYSYTPATADVGTTTLILNVFYQGILVNSATCSLVIKGQKAASANTRQLVTIGDSLVAFGSMLSELFNLSNINNASPGLIASITSSGTTATVTTFANHGLTGTPSVTIGGVVSQSGHYNGTFTVTPTGNNTFTYTMSGSDSSPAVALAAITSSGTMAIATTQGPHGFATGQSVTLAGISSTGGHYNGTFTVTVLGLNTFSYTMSGSDTPTGQLNNYMYFKTGADNLLLTMVGALTASSAADAQGTARAEKTDSVSGQTVAYFSTNAASDFALPTTITSGGAQGTNTAVLNTVAEIVPGTYVQLTGGTAEVLVVLSVNGGTKTVTFTSNIANTGHSNANWFAFGNYLTVNTLTLNANDWVYIDLGFNDIFAAKSDAAVYAVLSTAIPQLTAMIADIQASVAGIRIVIGIPNHPARQQEAFGINYGSSQTASRFRRNMEMWARAILQNWQNSSASKIFIAPLGMSVDTINNMQTVNTFVPNEYNNNLQTVQSNALHPATNGFYQMASNLWQFLRGQET